MRETSNRRTFLRRTSWLATAGLIGGAFSLSAASSVRKTIVGHQNFQYQVDKSWGDLDPNQYPVMHCHEMVMDEQGRLFLLTTEQRNNVLIYNKDGKLLDCWTLNLPEPHGLTIVGSGSDQTLWITDSEVGRVLNCTLDGRIIRELELPKGVLSTQQSYKPTETAVASNGDIYVADGYGSNYILQYDSKGQFKHFFGGTHHFDCAHGITLDPRGLEPTLLITSQAGNNFQRWSLAGKHLVTYSLPGLSICRPVIHGDQTYFAVITTKSWRDYDGMLAVLDRDMQVVSLPGGSAPSATQDFTDVVYDGMTFLNPHDVCIDEDENLYVPQWFSGRTYPVRLKRV
ncbi:MAG: 6-bladed beta-propeller [Bacteroidota bacterium]